MPRWPRPALASACLACTTILGDLDRIVALELVGPLTRQLEEGTTLILEARALRADGTEAPEAEILWAIVDTGVVGITVDPTSGLVTALSPDTAPIRARVEELTSASVTVIATPAPDSAAAAGDSRLDVAIGETSSPPLETVVFDLTTSPDTAAPLPGIVVAYALVDPAPGTEEAAALFLAADAAAEPGPDPHRHESTTANDGRAAVLLRLADGASPPDSALVDATVATAAGPAVAGSPVRFVVLFP